MSKKYKILIALYFIVIGIVILISDDLSNFSNTLSYVKCGNANGIPKPVPQLTSVAYTLLIIGTPIVLIAFSIVTLLKAITGGNADEVMKAKNKLFKKFIAAAIVFLSASIVQFVLLKVTTNDQDSQSVTACLKCFLYYSDTNCRIDDTKNKKTQNSYTPEKRSYSQPTTSSSNSNKTSNSNSNKSKGTKTILVGDSRTVGMCNFGTNGLYKGSKCKDYIAVAQVGKGLSWFKSTAIPAVNEILASDTNTRYNIVILLGVNDVGNKVNSESTAISGYTSTIKEQAEGDWKNHNIIFVSVTQVSNPKLSVGQQQINNFNLSMRINISNMKKSNVSYCDITSGLNLNGKIANDGVHYTTDGYTAMYNQIKNKCL